jgi:hypothetical protein
LPGSTSDEEITMSLASPFRRAFGSIALASLLAVAAIAGASALSTPSEKPILTVSGNISVTNKEGVAEFDRGMLEALGAVSFETQTPWYSEPVKFEGVPLAKLLAAVGASGKTLVAVALNNYSAELPLEDASKYNVIVALKRNGEYMTVRDKGPLFIVYPYDSSPELKNQKFYSRSVWQLSRLEVR